MAHGWRSMVINTQERALSVDINRLQRFKEQDTAELFRHLFDAYAASDDDQLGTITEPNTVETPLRAEIINGLMVKPQGGSLNLLVDAGLAFIMNPDAAADESNYKYIRDDGVTTPGSLVMSANASGSTRIDVIECRINATPLSVTDSRDIFNPTTGLFAAATVTKEQRGRLEYRVRAGTPGAGMPANQLGWLPLCVASVPNGTVSNDTITFWDVRPLLSDRVRNLNASPETWPQTERLHHFADNVTSGGQYRMYGRADVSHGGRRLGGVLRRGTPGTDADYVDLAAAANRSTDYTTPAPEAVERLRFVYLLTPFGLPRWARYTDGPAGRVPRAPRGIPVISNTKPLANGAPSVAVGLPTATGLGSSTTAGMMISVIAVDSTSFNLARADGRRVMFGYDQVELPGTLRTATPTAYTSEWTLTVGEDFPANAKFIYALFEMDVTIPINDNIYSLKPLFRVEIPGLGFATASYQERLPMVFFDGDGVGSFNGLVRWFMKIPVPPTATTAGATFKVQIDHQFLKTDTAALATMGTPQILTQGFEF